MNFVEPIRDPNTLEMVVKHLEKTNERNYIMFIIGLYTGLRISDILLLQVKHIDKNEIRIREKKTNKQRVIPLNNKLKRPLMKYIDDMESYEFIIQSREGINQPLSRSMAYKVIKELENYFRLAALGTHTMRKTFGYHYYKETKDVVTLQKIFNHSSQSETLKYIGITQDEISTAIMQMNYF